MLTVQADGGFSLEIRAEGDLDAWVAEFGGLEGLGLQLGEGTFQATTRGTWAAGGETITVVRDTFEVSANGRSMAELLEAAIPVLVDLYVDLQIEEQGLELTEEEVEALKATMAILVRGQLPELVADLEEQIAGPEATTYTYAVEGDGLILVDAEGNEEEWSRDPPSSAVEAVTWGQAKAAAR